MMDPSEPIHADHHINKRNSSKKAKESSGLGPPLMQVIQQSFSASSLLENIYAAAKPNKSNDTATTADSTNTSHSFDKEKSGEFANFLASREFDASAIITGDDERAVQDVNISAISDDFHIDAPPAAAAAPVFSHPIDDDYDVKSAATEAEAKASSGRKKTLVSVPDIDSSESNNEEQSWWQLTSSIQTLWEHIKATDHCNCLAGTKWYVDESGANAADTFDEIVECTSVKPPLTLEKSTSFVISNHKRTPVTPTTPLQRKLASTPVDPYAGITKQTKKYVSPMRVNYLEGNASSLAFSDTTRQYGTPNLSERSCRSVVTPLIGEHLVSTPLQGEDHYENSMVMSKASSHLFGEEILKNDVSQTSFRLFGDGVIESQQVEQYYPPPLHLLPAKIPQNEASFVSDQEFKTNATPDGSMFKLSQQGKGIGKPNKMNYMKRVKDRRRRKNDPV